MQFRIEALGSGLASPPFAGQKYNTNRVDTRLHQQQLVTQLQKSSIVSTAVTHNAVCCFPSSVILALRVTMARSIVQLPQLPPFTLFMLVAVTYFLVTAGIAYDVINEPPAVGGFQDPVTGRVKPQAFLPYRINAQYIMEGLCGGFFYTLGGVALVLLDISLDKSRDPLLRNICRVIGAISILVSYMATMGFLRIKMPGYLK